MSYPYTRRDVLRSGVAAGAVMGLGDLGFLAGLRPVSAKEAALDPKLLRLDPSIEPLVRLLEQTPREKLLEEIEARIRHGLSYREVLAALLLAGVKNVEPRPAVGFKFHAVLVVNSAHLASLASPPDQRWLPIFWALDYYKSAEARDVEERGDWTMQAVDESAVPPAHKAREEFVRAMDHWDEAAADAAVAGLVRTAGANEIYELCFRYGARDFRSIGHKAIFAANSHRTLSCIGWQYAEPVVRSLAYAMLMHEGSNPAQRDDEADRPFRRNQELVKKIRPDWRSGKLDPAATETMLATLRSGTPDEACDQVVKLINSGIAAQSIWDAMHLVSAEFLMRQPGIVSLHTVTTTNAMHFGFQTCAEDETRRLLMMQNAAFLPMFRAAMQNRGTVADTKITGLKAAAVGENSRQTVEEIFAELNGNPTGAAEKVLGLLRDQDARPAKAKELMDAARVLVFLKGDDAHDYKFSSAILEDYYHVSPQWRDMYLAANMFKLQGSQGADNALVQRTRAALGA